VLKGQPVPVLRMFDLAKTLDFYVGFLGFGEDWRHQFAPNLPVYMQVSKDGVRLHLSEHHGDVIPGSALRFEVEDVDAFCAELVAKEYRYSRPGVRATEWKSRETTIRDPAGNQLTFWSPAPPA
jgi:catechol 2,3-dioxygenase-like lactoylglutathione lyase family enzyme